MCVSPFARDRDDTTGDIDDWAFHPPREQTVQARAGDYELHGYDDRLGGPYGIVDARPGGGLVLSFEVRPDDESWWLILNGVRHDEPTAERLFAWWVAAAGESRRRELEFEQRRGKG